MNRLTKQEAALLLRISLPTLNRRMKDRKIKYIKDGRLVMFTESDLNTYNEKRSIKTA